jgi:hypothetical protein
LVGSWSVSAQDSPLTLDEAVTGTLTNSGAVNRWTFEGNRDDVLAFRLTIQEGRLTPRLRLYNSQETLLTELTAAPIAGQSDLIFRLPAFDRYTLEIQDPNLRGVDGRYELLMTLVEAGLRDFEQGELFFGQSVTQALNNRVPYHLWSFSGRAGQVVDIRMAAQSGDLQPVLSLTSPGGDVIASSLTDDPRSANLLALRLPGDGIYRISARREGESLGFGGQTQGRYELNLTLRNGPSATRLPLRSGADITGRLTLDSPMALYDVVDSGNYALWVELDNPTCLVAVGLSSLGLQVTPEQVGRSPFLLTLAVPNVQLPTLEISTRQCPAPERLDFVLTFQSLNSDLPIFPLPHQQTVYGEGQADLERWIFAGEAGDLIELRASKTALNGDSFIRLVSPSLVTLYRETFLNDFRQVLQLTQSGFYFVQIATNGSPYQLSYHLVGQNGQPLAFTRPIWEETLDIPAPQSRSFTALGEFDAQTILLVEDPTGQVVALARANRLNNARLENVALPSAGRYRIKVYGQIPPSSVLQTIVLGTTLTFGQAAKGTLTAATPVNTWEVNLQAGDELEVLLEGLNITTSTTNLVMALVNWNDQWIAPRLQESSSPGQLSALYSIPQNGDYRFIISTNGEQAFLDYRLQLLNRDALSPQEDTTRLVAPLGSGFAPTPVPTAIPFYITGALTPAAQALLPQASAISLPANLRAEVTSEQRYQLWRFNSLRNQTLNIQANALAADQSAPGLALLDENGQVIIEVWPSAGATSQLLYRTVSSGRYYLLLIAPPMGGRYWITAQTDPRLNEQIPSVLAASPLGLGQTTIADFQRSNETDTYAFWGERDNELAITAQLDLGAIRPRLVITSSSGRALAEADFDPATASARIPSVRLPDDGLYQVRVEAIRDSGEGYSRYSLSTILLRGQNLRTGLLTTAVVDSLGVNDTEAHWLFEVAAGESVSFSLDPLSNTGPTPLTLNLADSDGNVFLRQEADLSLNRVQVDSLMLPRGGVYQAIVTGGINTVGAYRLAIQRHSAPGQERALGYNQTRHGLLDAQNRLTRWVIAANQGDVLAISAHVTSGDPTPIGFQLETADEQLIVAGADRQNGYGGREEGILIPQTGLYTLLIGAVDPNFGGSAVYRVSLGLQNQTIQAATGSLVAFDGSYTSNLFADDPSDMWLFEGREGDDVTIRVVGDGVLIPVLVLYNTANNTSDAVSRSGTSSVAAELQNYILPRSGVYAIQVLGAQSSVGRYTLALTRNGNQLEAPQRLEVGLLYPGNIDNPQRGQQWTFTGQAGDQLTLTLAVPRRSELIPRLRLLTPDGQLLTEESRFDGKLLRLEGYSLPTSGLYSIDIQSPQTGDYELTFQLVPAPVAPQPRLLEYNSTGLNALSSVNGNDEWAFDGNAGDIVEIRAIRTSGDIDPVITLLDPVGQVIAWDDDSLGDLNARLQLVLPSPGRYRIRMSNVRPYLPTSPSNYRLELALLYQPALASLTKGQMITYGQRLIASFDPITPESSEFQTWFFNGQAGDSIQVTLQFPGDDSPLRLFLADGLGNRYLQGERVRDTVSIENFILPADGVYQLVVQRSLDSLITQYYPYSLSLSLQGADAGPTISSPFIRLGQSVTGQVTADQRSQAWLLDGQAGQTVQFSLVGLGGGRPSLTVLDQSNQVVLALPGSQEENQLSQSVNLSQSGIYQWVIGGLGEVQQPYRLSISSDSDSQLAGQLTLQQTEFGYFSPQLSRQRWVIAGYEGSLYVRLEANTNVLPLGMVLLDEAGQTIAQSTAGVTTSQTLSASLEAGQSYELVISKIGQDLNDASGNYQLRLSEFPIQDGMMAALTLSANDLIRTTTEDTQPRLYGFYGQQNVPTTIFINSDSQDPLDILIEDSLGQLIWQGVGTIADLRLPQDGFYFLQVSSRSASIYEVGIFPRPNAGGDRLLTTRREVNIAGTLSPNRLAQLWAIEAQPGETLVIRVSDFSTSARHELVLFDPDGIPIRTVLESELDNEAVIGPVFIGLGGTYTLRIGAWVQSITSETQHILRIDPAPQESGLGSEGGLIAVMNQAVRGGLNAQNAADNWQFNGRAGRLMSFALLPTSGDETLTLTLTSPSGLESPLELQTKDGDALLMANNVALVETGLYELTVALAEDDTRDLMIYELTLQAEQLALEEVLSTARLLALGQPQTSQLMAASLEAWVFYGDLGQGLDLTLNGQPGLVMTLLDPTGHILQATQNGSLKGIALTQAGFYSVVIHNPLAEPMTYTLTLTQASANVAWQETLALGQTQTATFSAGAGQHRWVLVDHTTGDYQVIVRAENPSLRLQAYIVDEAQNVISSSQVEASGGLAVTAYLSAGQSYALMVNPIDNRIGGSYLVNFDVALNRVSPAPIEVGRITVGRLDALNSRDEWLLQVRAGQPVSIQIKRLVGDANLRLQLYAPGYLLLNEFVLDTEGNINTPEIQLPIDGVYIIQLSRTDDPLSNSEGLYEIQVTSPNS